MLSTLTLYKSDLESIKKQINTSVYPEYSKLANYLVDGLFLNIISQLNTLNSPRIKDFHTNKFVKIMLRILENNDYINYIDKNKDLYKDRITNKTNPNNVSIYPNFISSMYFIIEENKFTDFLNIFNNLCHKPFDDYDNFNKYRQNFKLFDSIHNIMNSSLSYALDESDYISLNYMQFEYLFKSRFIAILSDYINNHKKEILDYSFFEMLYYMDDLFFVSKLNLTVAEVATIENLIKLVFEKNFYSIKCVVVDIYEQFFHELDTLIEKKVNYTSKSVFGMVTLEIDMELKEYIADIFKSNCDYYKNYKCKDFMTFNYFLWYFSRSEILSSSSLISKDYIPTHTEDQNIYFKPYNDNIKNNLTGNYYSTVLFSNSNNIISEYYEIFNDFSKFPTFNKYIIDRGWFFDRRNSIPSPEIIAFFPLTKLGNNIFEIIFDYPIIEGDNVFINIIERITILSPNCTLPYPKIIKDISP